MDTEWGKSSQCGFRRRVMEQVLTSCYGAGSDLVLWSGFRHRVMGQVSTPRYGYRVGEIPSQSGFWHRAMDAEGRNRLRVREIPSQGMWLDVCCCLFSTSI